MVTGSGPQIQLAAALDAGDKDEVARCRAAVAAPQLAASTPAAAVNLGFDAAAVAAEMARRWPTLRGVCTSVCVGPAPQMPRVSVSAMCNGRVVAGGGCSAAAALERFGRALSERLSADTQPAPAPALPASSYKPGDPCPRCGGAMSPGCAWVPYASWACRTCGGVECE